jgi:hypothetical protein
MKKNNIDNKNLVTIKKIFRHFSFIAFFAATAITFLIIQLIKYEFLPVQIEVAQQNISTESTDYTIIIDVDKDGINESLTLLNNQHTNTTSLILKNNKQDIIEQFNIRGKVLDNGLMFGNSDTGNYIDIIAIYNANDSIYLDIISTQKKEYIVNKEFLIARPDSSYGEFWDVKVVEGSELILDGGKRKLIFGLNSGYSVYPRAIYVYELNQQIRKFETSAPLTKIIIDDVDYNGEKEIVVATHVAGNVKTNIKFSDRTSWLYILDTKLTLLEKPLTFGQYPGSSLGDINLIKIENKKYIFTVYNEYRANRRTFLLFDEKLIIKQQWEFEDLLIYDLAILEKGLVSEIICTTSDSLLLIMDNKFNIIYKTDSKLERALLFQYRLFNKEGKKEIIAVGTNGVETYDENYNLSGRKLFKANSHLSKNYFSFSRNNLINTASLLHGRQPYTYINFKKIHYTVCCCQLHLAHF